LFLVNGHWSSILGARGYPFNRNYDNNLAKFERALLQTQDLAK